MFATWLDELPELAFATEPYQQDLEGAPAVLGLRQRLALRRAGYSWANTELGWADRLDRVISPDAPVIKAGKYQLIPAEWTYPRYRHIDTEVASMFLACHLYAVCFEQKVRIVSPTEKGFLGSLCRLQRRLYPSQRGFFAPMPTGPVISVNPELDPLEKARTLTHELAHALLHHPLPRSLRSLSAREVEAEAATYLVMRAWGLNDERELRYIHTWDHKHKKLPKLNRGRVLDVAAVLVGNPRPPR